MPQGRDRKPIVYIASPYTGGDVAINTHFQCRVFDQLLEDGKFCVCVRDERGLPRIKIGIALRNVVCHFVSSSCARCPAYWRWIVVDRVPVRHESTKRRFERVDSMLFGGFFVFGQE